VQKKHNGVLQFGNAPISNAGDIWQKPELIHAICICKKQLTSVN